MTEVNHNVLTQLNSSPLAHTVYINVYMYIYTHTQKNLKLDFLNIDKQYLC